MNAVSKKGVRRVRHRPYQASYYLYQARKALEKLESAREYAKAAGAPYLGERIRLAISSARGAVRNAGYRVTRAPLRAGTDDDRA